MTKKGTALIYVLLISGVVTAIGLAVARLSITEIRMSRLASESITAYYAAEAGLEDGLAEWRWNRDVEVPAGASQGSSDTRPVTLDDDPNNIISYQLKIWYKGDSLGIDDGKWNESDPKIEKDQTREIDVEGLSAVTLKYRFYDKPDQSGEKITHGVEVIQIDKNSDFWKTDLYQKEENDVNININIAIGAEIKLLRIKPWTRDPNGFIRITVSKPEPATGKIDTGTTTIESTGLYKDTKRKLVATIDRKSGTILNVYDFLFYGGEWIRQ